MYVKLTVEPLQKVVAGQNLYVIDTSQTNALITTGNLSTSVPQPFELYTVLKSSDYVFSSLSKSFCVFRSNPSLFTTANAKISMTTRGAGGLPKQQFNNCQLVFNLPFCTETAYAAPANPDVLNSSHLATIYDSLASQLFTNFSTTLQLHPCNTTFSAQYSLFRNCTTCLQAYKNWLCAVTIPRCADATDTLPFLFPRAVNTSRNPLIDQIIRPRAYKEIMPCRQLCWCVEQNCPITLGFQCPSPRSFAMRNSYVEDNEGKTCNAPQRQYLASRGSKLEMGGWVGVVVLVHLAFRIAWGI